MGVTPTISIKGAPPARLRIILGERLDHKGEYRSFAWLRFNGHPPAVTIGERLTDGELYS
jgi:hypothetical protein